MIPALKALKGQGLELDVELRAMSRGVKRIKIEYFLCSDHKLVATVLGHGGAGCKSCCPLCDWRKSGIDNASGMFTEGGADAAAPYCAHTEEYMRKHSGYATRYLKPLQAANSAIRL